MPYVKFVPIFLPLVLSTRLCSGEWSQWQGPNRNGEVDRDTPLPGSVSKENLRLRWSAPLAEGYSSPVVSEGIVYTLESKEATFEIARGFDLATGTQVWKNEWKSSMKVPFFANKNGSWVKSTPTAAGGGVYFGGMRDVLVKLDAKTGKEIWKLDFPALEKTVPPAFGHVASPLVDGNFLYTQAASAVLKLNIETGEIVWRALKDDRAMFGSAFSSPVLATIQGEKQLIVQTRMNLSGLDAETGETRWTILVKAFRGMNILTPTVIGNRIFTATYGGGSFLYEIEVGSESAQKVKLIWNDEKLEGYMGSPLLIDGYIYLHGRDKKLHCISLADGKQSWTSEEEFGEYWSMIRKDNRVLALDQKGELILFDANPEKFQLLGRLKISDESTWAHLGMAGDVLLVRGLKSISVFDWK